MVRLELQYSLSSGSPPPPHTFALGTTDAEHPYSDESNLLAMAAQPDARSP